MLPAFVLPETTVNENAAGPALELGQAAGQVLVLTLGILDVVEQESLDLSFQGSSDGEEWNEAPVRAFPQKFYAGTYSILVDLSTHPDVKYLRANWTVNRWGVGSLTPMFKFYVFAEVFEETASAKTA